MFRNRSEYSVAHPVLRTQLDVFSMDMDTENLCVHVYYFVYTALVVYNV